jgi:diguanylate cyclase (GGDEF)-like protein
MYDAGLIWESYIHPDDRALYHQEIADIFDRKRDRHQIEYRVRNRNGNYVICSCQGIVLPGEQGVPDLFAGTIVNQGIVSNVDAATDLYNTYEFINATQQLVRTRKRAMLMLVRLNQFQNINTIYGYITGTRLLKGFADLLTQLVRGEGMAYRIDGAKFALRLNDPDPERAQKLYQVIQQAAEQGIPADGQMIPLRTCAGAVLLDGSYSDSQMIQSCLFHALQQSKLEHQGALVLFHSAKECTDLDSAAQMETLRLCVRDHCRGFYLTYQPVVEPKTGRTIGAEALLRWQDESGKTLMPNAFIQWLEQDRCYFQLGDWIMRQALTEMLPFAQADPNFRVSINIAYTQLSHDRFRDTLIDALNATGFPPEQLYLELTERCRAGELSMLRNTLLPLKQLGVMIALDDFGTGTASIQLLRDLPVDCIKIDRTFVVDIMTNPTDEILVEFITGSAQKLGIAVCVEGIETEEQRTYISKFPVSSHQGYLYARPLTLPKFRTHWEQEHQVAIAVDKPLLGVQCNCQ